MPCALPRRPYRQAEAAADGASKALEKINVAVEAQRGKMKAAMDAADPAAFWRAAAAAEKLAQKQAEAATRADAAKSAVAAEAAALDRLKNAAQQAAGQEEHLAKAHEKAQKTADAMKKAEAAASGSGKVNELAEAFGRLGGPLGSVGQKAFGAADGIKKLVSAAGTGAGPYIAIAVAIVALSSALIVGAAAILKFAVANADAARSSELLAQGIAQSEAGGSVLNKQINELSKRVPQSREELRNMAAELAKTGLRGKELGDALESAAVKAAEAKFGPAWERQLLSLDKQSQVFKGHLGDLFRLPDGAIDKILGALSKLVALFDESSVTGKAIQVVFQDVFGSMADGVASLAPKVVALFIQLEIWALRGLIAIKPYGSTFVTVAKLIGVAILAVGAVLAVAIGFMVGMSAAVGTLIGGLVWLATKFVEVTGIGQIFWAALQFGWTAVKAVFEDFKNTVLAVVTWLQSVSLADIGTAMIDGLINGITGAGSRVLDSVKNVVGGAIDGAKNLLGIASPSKVFAEIGAHTATGMAEGVDGGAGEVHGALEQMVAPPEPKPNAAASSGAKSGAGRSFSGAIFNFFGVKDAEHARDLFLAMEDDLAQLGLAIPEGT